MIKDDDDYPWFWLDADDVVKATEDCDPDNYYYLNTYTSEIVFSVSVFHDPQDECLWESYPEGGVCFSPYGDNVAFYLREKFTRLLPESNAIAA